MTATSKDSVADSLRKAQSTPSSIEKESVDDQSDANVLQAAHGDDSFPDGGLRAWLIAFGGLCNCLSTFGFVNSWGTFQSYYESNILSESSPSNIAWIGSTQYALTFLPCLVAGRMFDLGWFKLPQLIFGVLLIVATVLTAECKTYWQFLLCQGIAVGISSGMIFGPTLGVISHWFKKRRATALGVVACGSSFGGTLFPIAFQKLVQQIGFQWTMRALALIMSITLIIANLTLARRLPPTRASGGLLNLSAFRHVPYSVYTLSGFITFLGLYTALTYIGISAVAKGVSENFSLYLVPIANASSLIGRIGGGIVADWAGPINTMVPFTALAGILTFIWPFVTGEPAYIAVAIVYGMASGVYVSLLAAPIIGMGGTSDVGRRIGMFMSILALGAVSGPPISGAINTAVDGFGAVGIYAGSTVLLSVFTMILSKYLAIGSVTGRF